MTPRRGFLALVGGAGAVAGSVLFRKSAAAPALILPPDFVSSSAVAEPLLPTPAEMDAVNTVKAGLPHAVYLDWLEGGLRLVEDCKPDGGAFRAFWSDATLGQISPPPRRFIGDGGRTKHERAYLDHLTNNLKRSVDQSTAWSEALPIRRGSRS